MSDGTVLGAELRLRVAPAAGEGRRLGATPLPDGVRFALLAPRAIAVWLVLWPEGRDGARRDVPLDAATHRSGDVWQVEVLDVAPPLEWAWRVAREAQPAGPPPDPERLLLDPWARAISGAERWGEPAAERRCLLPAEAAPPWGDRPPRPLHAPADRVVYELCVRGFTAHPSSKVAARGTFAGLAEKIPHLRDLGVTTVELLPIVEWDEREVRQRNPFTGAELRNLWGYSPLAVSAPKAGLAAAAVARDGGQLRELRALVDALHAAGIEVLLDVVFNHTGETTGPPAAWSFGGLDPLLYYLVDGGHGRYADVTGCGNTISCNEPAVVELLVDALRFWVEDLGVDGFRFDLASVLLRDPGGRPLDDPPLLRRIEEDPVLRGRVLVAEPWDAVGLYALGRFARRAGWAEWNDRFRDGVRRFVRGEPGRTGDLAARLAGSEDVFGGAPLGPAASINFVTCHDGFTLADLVSFDRKHNDENGEGNRDGSDWNASWNHGVEGPTQDVRVRALRGRDMRNLLTLLLVAQGTPMLLAGDEMGRTQRGNNNAWCQDDEVGWVDWRALDADPDLLRFVRGLIAFRRTHPVLRRRAFLRGGTAEAGGARPDVAWHGAELGRPDWGPGAHALAMHLAGEHAPEPDDDVYLAANNGEAEATFALPAPPAGKRWRRVVATWLPAPRDLLPAGEEEPVAEATVVVPPRSCLLLRSG